MADTTRGRDDGRRPCSSTIATPPGSSPAASATGRSLSLRVPDCAVGPVPAMVRPWRPSDAQDTSDPGPPDRRALTGASTPSAVVVLRTEKLRSARPARPLSSRPLATSQVPATTAAQPRALAARGPHPPPQPPGGPPVEPAQRPGQGDQSGEHRRRGRRQQRQGQGAGRGRAHEVTELGLPPQPQAEGEGQGGRGRDGEDPPGPGRGGRGSRSTRARQTQAPATPSP